MFLIIQSIYLALAFLQNIEWFIQKNKEVVSHVLVSFPTNENIFPKYMDKSSQFQIDISLKKDGNYSIGNQSYQNGCAINHEHINGTRMITLQIEVESGCDTIDLQLLENDEKVIQDLKVKIPHKYGKKFKFGASSCAQTGTQTPIYSKIQNQNLNLFLQLGDIHYSGTNWSKFKDFQFSYYEIFHKLQAPSDLYQNQPLSYVIDDHDFGSNNADSTASSNVPANQAYRSSIRPFQSKIGFNHSYEVQIGDDRKLKFIVMDCRSFKNKTQNYGKQQLNWVKAELKSAEQNEQIKGVFVVHSWPWKSKREWESKNEKHTDMLRAERKDLADFIESLDFNGGKDSRILAMISGDLHALTYDHGGYGSNIFGHFPIFQCAPMNQRNSCSASQQYSHQPNLQNGQYCVFEFEEDNCLKFTGFAMDQEVMSWNSCTNHSARVNQNQEYDTYLENLMKIKDDEIEPQMKEMFHEYVLENGYGHPAQVCPMKPKEKFRILNLMFWTFWCIILMYNIFGKLCPSIIE